MTHDIEVVNAGYCGGCEACGCREEYLRCRRCDAEWVDEDEECPVPEDE